MVAEGSSAMMGLKRRAKKVKKPETRVLTRREELAQLRRLVRLEEEGLIIPGGVAAKLRRQKESP